MAVPSPVCLLITLTALDYLPCQPIEVLYPHCKLKMLSRVLRIKPTALKSFSLNRSLHASAERRADFVQDLYSQEIKAFKPRTLTDKDAEGVVLKWAIPTTPKAPGEEVNVSELDSYSGAAVEIEGASGSEGAEAESSTTSGDWFPIESCDALDGEHH